MKYMTSLTILLSLASSAASAEDLAMLTKGVYAFDFLKKPAVRTVLKKQMSPADFATMMDYARNGVSTPGEEANGIVRASVCKAHDCADNRVEMAFDHKSKIAVQVIAHTMYGEWSLLPR
jgi:hypothetical protein